jgi:replicative DNA helicase
MSIQHNFGILLCSQISRANVEGQKEPTLTGLKSTGALEEHGDKILLLHWPAHYDHTADLNKFKVIIAKNKGGRTGEITINFEPEYYRFRDSKSVACDERLDRTVELFQGQVTGVEGWT